MTQKTSDIKGVKELIDICVGKGMEYVVISPGSRNAPLSISLARDNRIQTPVIVDERSAGYFALGIAQQTGKPVGLVCTSGTALLNYAPAVAEAFYQRLPIVVLSADRPQEWIGQDDSQAINQVNVLQNFVKASYHLPIVNEGTDDLWSLNRMMNEALSKSISGRLGPVHINIPFREPLYGEKNQEGQSERIVNKIVAKEVLSEEIKETLVQEWRSSNKVMILAGLLPKNEKLNACLSQLAKLKQVVVLTESISNLHDQAFLPCIDRVITSFSEEESQNFQPDLLINFGGPLVSKKIKSFLRDHAPKKHWFVGKEDRLIDTFRALSSHIDFEPECFFEDILSLLIENESSYADDWRQRDLACDTAHEDYLKNTRWSDLKAFEAVLAAVPDGANLQLSNSSVVRYAQLFKTSPKLLYNSNRGTSGIDGCTSTAVGACHVNDKLTTLITGDISFFYDTNGLWNKYLNNRLKIVLINNGGGGIFRFIPGPSDAPELEEYFETVQDYRADKLAETYGLDYFYADSLNALESVLPNFFELGEKACILELKTPREMNDVVLKDYFKNLRK
ncbi:2-succinyl-5-enolpyruvyl-6-hydroxy-3-cyclohexene-1-carboxylic-acid synthase [Ancylomarina salipaludis]|uniref:2-succinyl-5-enolpyruvyl-6-hydroxy-3-cyclohexene-1-carboxylate synthase n=1 Tax=Ancylomarina salipaludis TaxID=2501299 RepID=A0A4Q1JL66_9BACT|nr:2-succinyl-5-enolpyruvyl-6-hydroxy-3-cyclohexene-1-carboxylic-acid synthase [Ancylomarina salipaludis]RXQ94410.1 2-succinyl-5-enolpyruvyl-6-hydroxy-3-cyclohexene-1-carboxylic-acid synthase [Ancylomarina salipaludis]